ncbi:hypothetical protein MKW94_008960 [Papaver nudicaule]|uniref:60S acidic ribosomal protein P3 n=1 Tax=Papaver nudicaule TaxID=74823 RepID=A0AA41V605_PAPNU|nr:hypothetical protein [Papaver nudicaule]
MGVFIVFVCKSSDGVWSAKQYKGKLVKEAVSRDSGEVRSSFLLVNPSSAVFDGGGGAPRSAGDLVAVEAPAAEDKKEEKEESDDDLGGFFDDLF